MANQFFVTLLLLILLHLCSSTDRQVSAELVLEEGYTVSTLLDGNKLQSRINPSSALPRFGGTRDLLILDTPSSAFYAIKFPISQDSEINRLSGNGSAGFSDGGLSSAMFDHPRSFAVDFKGNVYVADKNNHVIRKISNSGVSTIAGGHSGKKPGKVDGPAQYASFSEDFELVFVPQLCALVISDRGNRLIRQLTLMPEDCGTASQPQLGLVWVSLLGGLCLLIGSAIGIAAYPYLASREVACTPLLRTTWKHCQIHLGRKVLIVCSDIRSAVASSAVYSVVSKLVGMSISQLSLMFRILRVEKQSLYTEPPSLLETYNTGRHEVTKSDVLVDQLKDLISFDEDLNASEVTGEALKEGDQDNGSQVVGCSGNGGIDGMIQKNILSFDEQANQRNLLGASLGSSGLVNRKKKC